MTKPVSCKRAKKRAWDAFSLYIRTRDCILTTGCPDWGLCVTCGKRYHIKLLQAGHLVAGRHNAGLIDEEGVHAQCYNCNVNLKGNTLVYRRMVVAMYGEGADLRIEKRAEGTLQRKAFEWLEIEKVYKEKTDDLRRNRPVKNPEAERAV